MAEELKEKRIRLSTEPQHADDFTFVLDGTRYYTDKSVGEDKEMLAVRALRELEKERDKSDALYKELEEERE